jgi:hypothetical protein
VLQPRRDLPRVHHRRVAAAAGRQRRAPGQRHHVAVAGWRAHVEAHVAQQRVGRAGCGHARAGRLRQQAQQLAGGRVRRVKVARVDADSG